MPMGLHLFPGKSDCVLPINVLAILPGIVRRLTISCTKNSQTDSEQFAEFKIYTYTCQNWLIFNQLIWIEKEGKQSL